MYIYLEDGTRHNVRESDVLGSGGEGTVFRLPGSNGLLAKVYENPTPVHGQKLQSFLNRRWHLPSSVAAPQKLVRNSSGQIIGFTMAQFSSAHALKEFANRRFRTTNGITNVQVLDVLIDAYQSLETIHPQGLIIGDLNDLNLLFANQTTCFIDVDSWQFDTFPCPVATESFLDPALYGQNLSLKPLFSPNNDWYSFAVLLFRSLLLVHPYGGNHPVIKTLPERALKRISVFDKEITYPSIGLPKEILSDDLLDAFSGIFSKGDRDCFPKDILLAYRRSLTQCPSCNSWFPNTRHFCPVCHEKSIVHLPPVVVSGQLSITQLLNIPGHIILAKNIDDQEIYALAKETDGLVFYKLSRIRPPKRIVVGRYQNGSRFDLNKNHIVQSCLNSETLNVFQIQDNEVTPCLDTTSDIFSSTQNTVFHLSGNRLYRIAGSTLTQTEFKGNYPLETPVRQVIPGQTWFTVSDPLPEPIILGCFRVFRQQQYWLVANGKNHDLILPPLEPGEGIVDITAKFCADSALLLRHTKQAGLDYVRMDIVDLNGRHLFSDKILLSSLPDEKIHGLVYSHRQLLTATDEGVIRFDPATKSLASFPVTKGHVDTTTSLLTFQRGLLTIGDNSLNFLSLS